MSIGVDGTGAVRHSFSPFDGVRTQPARYRHDNDRELPRTPNEIYELNRAMVRRMNGIFTDRGIPVVPSIGTLVFLWSFCFEWMGCCVEALTLTTYVHTYEMLRCSTLLHDFCATCVHACSCACSLRLLWTVPYSSRQQRYPAYCILCLHRFAWLKLCLPILLTPPAYGDATLHSPCTFLYS